MPFCKKLPNGMNWSFTRLLYANTQTLCLTGLTQKGWSPTDFLEKNALITKGFMSKILVESIESSRTPLSLIILPQVTSFTQSVPFQQSVGMMTWMIKNSSYSFPYWKDWVRWVMWENTCRSLCWRKPIKLILWRHMTSLDRISDLNERSLKNLLISRICVLR